MQVLDLKLRYADPDSDQEKLDSTRMYSQMKQKQTERKNLEKQK